MGVVAKLKLGKVLRMCAEMDGWETWSIGQHVWGIESLGIDAGHGTRGVLDG